MEILIILELHFSSLNRYQVPLTLFHTVRFPFKKVFLIFFIIYASLTLISVVTADAFPKAFRPDLYRTYSFYLRQLVSLVFHTCFYYYAFNQYYSLFSVKKGVSAVLISIGLLMGVYILYLVAYEAIFEIKQSLEGMKIGLTTLIISYLLSLFFTMGIGIMVAYITYLLDEKKQRKILEEQKVKLEVEKTHANLNFLKAQINPHFLHNTLNFLYAKSIPYSAELSEGILTLSDIMRYALSESNIKDGKAALKDEIEHVRNVIKIHQLRYSNTLQVNFEVNGVINGTTIIPFVLITIVENAFKHGELKNAEAPIDLKLSVKDNTLLFYCRNKKKTGPKELSTGIGLDNIKKRLDLAYPGNYHFDIKDEPEFYTTQLTIHTL